jgi:glycosyltransferase involved in cell wall biosynthesis
MAKRRVELDKMLASLGVSPMMIAKAGKSNNFMAITDRQGNSGVEILIDSREPMITGAKRNELIEAAQGKYICFVDDDDTVSPDYISSILTALQSRPDCVGVEGLLTWGDGTQQIFKHSIQFAGWYTGPDDVYYRTPNHLNPVKREIARSVGFAPNLTIGEDVDYSKRLRPWLSTEEYIDHPIYNYDCTNRLRDGRVIR